MENALTAGSKTSDVRLTQTLKGTNEFQFMGPEDSAVYGAYGCFEENPSFALFEFDRLNEKPKSYKKIFDETAGRGHGSVTDQSCFVWSMQNVTRATTLFLCGPEYMSHLQQSLRRAKADKGFHIPEILKDEKYKHAIEVQIEAFNLYDRMLEGEVPGEDARYILPLNTYTNIQTLTDARELMHLSYMSKTDAARIPNETKSTVSKMYELSARQAPEMMQVRPNSMEVRAWNPSLQLYAKQNLLVDSISESYWEEDVRLFNKSLLTIFNDEKGLFKQLCKTGDEASLSVLKHFHFTFFVRMSLAAFHQAIRQRTWNISCQSIYSAMISPIFMTPPSVTSSKFVKEFEELQMKMVQTANELIEMGVPAEEVVGIIPHSMCVGSLIHVNGWNAIHSIAKRTCTKAQWDIRKKAVKMAAEIIKSDDLFDGLVGPQCEIYGRCPESKPCRNI